MKQVWSDKVLEKWALSNWEGKSSLVAKIFDWDEEEVFEDAEEVFEDEEVTQVK
nr:hypothetical protein [Tanacetum cinerariifolium]